MSTAARPRKDTCCSFCGQRYLPEQPWPRTCAGCGATSYQNPLPVAVLLLPVDGGLLAIRRGIEPRRGELALPGGYIGLGESWQEAGARELREETGIRIDPAGVETFDVLSAPDGTVLVFGLAAPVRAADLPAFTPTDETTERVVIAGPQEMAFPLHTRVVARYFASRETP